MQARALAWDEAQRRANRLPGDDGPDDVRSVPVVLRVILGSHRASSLRSRLLEANVALHAARADPTLAWLEGSLEPGVVVPVGRTHIDVVVSAHGPDGHVGPETSVGP